MTTWMRKLRVLFLAQFLEGLVQNQESRILNAIVAKVPFSCDIGTEAKVIRVLGRISLSNQSLIPSWRAGGKNASAVKRNASGTRGKKKRKRNGREQLPMLARLPLLINHARPSLPRLELGLSRL